MAQNMGVSISNLGRLEYLTWHTHFSNLSVVPPSKLIVKVNKLF